MSDLQLATLFIRRYSEFIHISEFRISLFERDRAVVVAVSELNAVFLRGIEARRNAEFTTFSLRGSRNIPTASPLMTSQVLRILLA
jgi:hypothetical protein